MSDKSKIPIHCSCSATLKIPFSSPIVRKSRIGMLKIGNQHEPMVDPKIRDNIIAENR